MVLAKISLPVPEGPRIRVLMGRRAMARAWATTCRMAGQRPMMRRTLYSFCRVSTTCLFSSCRRRRLFSSSCESWSTFSSNSARWNSRASTLTIIMPKASARRSSSGEELPSRVRANRASSSAGRPQARSSHRRISRARVRAFFSCMAYPWRRDCTQRSTSATGPMRSWGI